jgi:hypothetical protein
MNVFSSFFNLLYSSRVSWGANKLCRAPSNKGLFNVRLFYKVLVPHPFPWKNIWWNKVPLIVAFFTWSVAQGKIITIDNLRKRHVIVVDWCFMYKKCGESVDHIFLHCEIASATWSAILSHVGLSQVMPRRVVDLFACWRGLSGSPQSEVV